MENYLNGDISCIHIQIFFFNEIYNLKVSRDEENLMDTAKIKIYKINILYAINLQNLFSYICVLNNSHSLLNFLTNKKYILGNKFITKKTKKRKD